VADRLVVRERAAAAGQGAGLVADRAELAAARAGGFGGKGLGLLLQQRREGALGQAAGRGVGDLLQGKQIDVETRSGVAEGAAGNNSPPLGGQVTYILEFLGGEFGSGHQLSCLALASRNGEVFVQLFYRRVLQLAK
jgi:hypothetical protein